MSQLQGKDLESLVLENIKNVIGDGNDIEFPAVSLLKLLEQDLWAHKYPHDGSYDEEGILSAHKQISFLRLQLDLFEEKLKNLKISEKKG